MVEPFTLTMARVLEPRLLARRRAARVSIVSPDWEMMTARVSWSTRGSSYRNSDAMDTVTGMCSTGSMRALATMPACMAVPQAIMWILVHWQKSSSGMLSSVKSGRPFDMRGRMVFFRAWGCSWISLSMKWGKPFFMAESMFQFTSMISGDTGVPSISYREIL